MSTPESSGVSNEFGGYSAGQEFDAPDPDMAFADDGYHEADFDESTADYPDCVLPLDTDLAGLFDAVSNPEGLRRILGFSFYGHGNPA